ncbi:Sjogren's syndrome/scleroderma autoantigen 1 family protein [Haloprofundus halobius]|uniref:Sjogren's syndrome/scleroderma autoantigen 1 family protein n=1 Tax=Haloprofundus halobius TaxID=2876194 RepID=UPI001CCA8F10|nr:Sjogren's syndrome/scleroderma autoantigen 1 family protein [Haloprofundus halobius]
MSEFDKEAEREKLRKKFARDEEKRKSTQRMSELLLKGATMTNRHCDTCGDPIFRYQDQEFCPTCQNAQVAESNGAAQTGDSKRVTDETPTTDATRTAESEPGQEAAENDGDPEVELTSESQAPQRAPAAETDRSTATGTASAPTESADASTVPNQPKQHAESDLSEARAALVRTVTRYATAAESADDPRRATELLSAAREAAETLSALNR